MTNSHRKLVTIALPLHRRLEYLPQVLRLIEAQDYPAIELLVSDNGMNGDRVSEIVRAGYSRPYRFRQNPVTIEMIPHFNQLIEEARGEYFFLLCDDDEISPNYISELVRALELHPEASLAFSRQEVLDLEGNVIMSSTPELPEIVTGPEFILGTWERPRFGFKSISAFLARTDRERAVGLYPCFTRGTHPDDAMVVKLSLDNQVAFSPRCVWRNRLYETSNGMAIPISDLAAATREYLEFLATDPTIRRFASQNPAVWARVQPCLVKMAWRTYYTRWNTMYRRRMSFVAWACAAFAMPYIPAYYRKVVKSLVESAREIIAARLGMTPRPNAG